MFSTQICKCLFYFVCMFTNNSICSVMVIMFVTIGRELEPCYSIILVFAWHSFKSNIKCWLARNQNNVFEWSNMSTRGLLFHSASTIKIQLSVLVRYKADIIITSFNVTCLSPWYSYMFNFIICYSMYVFIRWDANKILKWIAKLLIRC